MRIIKALGAAIGGILLLCAPLIFNSGTCFEAEKVTPSSADTIPRTAASLKLTATRCWQS